MISLGVISLDHPHVHESHFPALRYIRDRIRVKAIFHDKREEAEHWLKEFLADYYSDRDSLLSRGDIDAVLITSRNYRHAADSIAAAEAGKDVLCDKPIATSVEDAVDIFSAVRKNGVRFITTFPVRFNSSIQQLKKIVDDGGLGKITGVMATNHGCMYEPGEPAWC